MVNVNVTRLVVHRGHRWTDGACVEKGQKDKDTIDVDDSKSLVWPTRLLEMRPC